MGKPTEMRIENTTPETLPPLPENAFDAPEKDDSDVAVLDPGEDAPAREEWQGEDDGTGPEPGEQLSMIDDEEARAVSDNYLRFLSGDEAKATAVALNGYASDLASLAKKAKDLGRNREALSLEREAKLVRESLLSQLESQVAIPFDDAEPLQHAMARYIGFNVRHAVVRVLQSTVKLEDGESYDDGQQRMKDKIDEFEKVIGAIAEQGAAVVQPVLFELAERAYTAGITARETTPESLVRNAVQAVASR